jgi:hypothetical protein
MGRCFPLEVVSSTVIVESKEAAWLSLVNRKLALEECQTFEAHDSLYQNWRACTRRRSSDQINIFIHLYQHLCIYMHMYTTYLLYRCVAAASFGLAMDQNLMAPNLSAIALECVSVL